MEKITISKVCHRSGFRGTILLSIIIIWVKGENYFFAKQDGVIGQIVVQVRVTKKAPRGHDQINNENYSTII